jgi:hypothetical protein
MIDPASHRSEGDPGLQLQRGGRAARGSSPPGSEGEAEGKSRDANHGAADAMLYRATLLGTVFVNTRWRESRSASAGI